MIRSGKKKGWRGAGRGGKGRGPALPALVRRQPFRRGGGPPGRRGGPPAGEPAGRMPGRGGPEGLRAGAPAWRRTLSSMRAFISASVRLRRSTFSFARARSPAFCARIWAILSAIGNLEPLRRALRVVEAGERHAREALADGPLDGEEVPLLVGRDEGERVAGRLGPGGPADAVDVVVRDVRHVEVHDVRELLDVDAARGDVGRHEDAVLAALEAGERLGPLRLGAVPVDPLARHVLLLQEVGEAVGAVLRPREGDDAPDLAPREELEEELRLQLLRHRVDGLRDADGGSRLALQVDRRRGVEDVARELGDRAGHRRREEQVLPLGGEVPQDALDVGEEAHVEHPVGLVDDEDLQPVELRVAETEVVEEAAGSRDDDVDPGAEGVLLRPHADAAEDGGARERRVDGELPRVLVDLGGQLARRRDDQDAREPARLPDETVEDREDEGGRLAASRHRAGEEVLAGEGGGDRVVLDRGGPREAQLLDAAEEVGVETEGREGHSEFTFRRPVAARTAHLLTDPRRSKATRSGRRARHRRKPCQACNRVLLKTIHDCTPGTGGAGTGVGASLYRSPTGCGAGSVPATARAGRRGRRGGGRGRPWRRATSGRSGGGGR